MTGCSVRGRIAACASDTACGAIVCRLVVYRTRFDAGVWRLFMPLCCLEILGNRHE
jgi:hypothetical protein